jgi:hypothetical protein
MVRTEAEVRVQKVQQLREQGIEPYPSLSAIAHRPGSQSPI